MHYFFPVKIIFEAGEFITRGKKGHFSSLAELYLFVFRIHITKKIISFVCFHSSQDRPGGLLTSAHSQLCYMHSGL